MARRHMGCALAVVGFLLIGGHIAFADTVINLNQNNLGISGTLGTVTLHQIDGNDIQVSLDFTNYAAQLNANKAVDFQTNITGLGASNIELISLTAGGTLYNATPTALTVGGPGGNGNIGIFQIDLSQFNAGQPNGTTAATEIVFDVSSTGITAANFVPNSAGNIFGVHFCSTSSSGCGTPTGWTWDGPSPSPTPVPEPSSMLLIGTCFPGIAFLLRRQVDLSRRH